MEASDKPSRTLKLNEFEKRIISPDRVEHEEINRHYSAADIYLNASKIDNQPLSILEAFACGLPVVTTDAGGIPDIVTDEKTGFLVPVGDYEALAAHALKLLTHPRCNDHDRERAG